MFGLLCLVALFGALVVEGASHHYYTAALCAVVSITTRPSRAKKPR